MKRQTYLRFFKKWIKNPCARVLFVPDAYYKSCLYIMSKRSCFGVSIVKKSYEDLYWLTIYSGELEDLPREDFSYREYIENYL